MSNKPIDMYKIRQLLRLYAFGKGTKFISHTTGIARNTVKKYLQHFASLSLSLAQAEAMSDAQLARAFLIQKPATPNQRIEDLESLLPDLVACLRKRGVTKKMVYDYYCSKCSDPFKHSAFHAHRA